MLGHSKRRRSAGGGRPRLGHDDKPFSQDELRELVEHLARKAAAERRGQGADKSCPRPVRGPRARDLALVQLAALTGLRASELAELEVRDICLARRKSYLRVRGGKARDRRAVETVPIPWSFVAELGRWIKGRGQRAAVFPASTSSRKLTRWEVWRIVKRGVRACGLRDVLTVHSLRHYYISTVARSAPSTLAVASLARLRSLRLVETYLHAALVDRHQVVDELRIPGRRSRALAAE